MKDYLKDRGFANSGITDPRLGLGKRGSAWRLSDRIKRAFQILKGEKIEEYAQLWNDHANLYNFTNAELERYERMIKHLNRVSEEAEELKNEKFALDNK